METIQTTGRRKTSVARVQFKTGTGKIIVNKRNYKEYFPVKTLQLIIEQPYEKLDIHDVYDLIVNVSGGGISGQAVAIRHALSRALIKAKPDTRPPLKKAGFLTRDSRMVERKKFGRKKARKRFQFSKR